VRHGSVLSDYITSRNNERDASHAIKKDVSRMIIQRAVPGRSYLFLLQIIKYFAVKGGCL
jgi:hypothetical protein